MPAHARVARPPERPLVIFDGDCGFCRKWIARWKQRTGQSVDYEPSQVVGPRFPEIRASAFAKSVQLVLPDGRVFQAAEAVAWVLALTPGRGAPLWIYQHVAGAAPVAEVAYRAIADHRTAASAATRVLWGRSVLKPTYFAASALFVRLLGVIYLAAFLSLWVQVHGLVGAHGILPVGEFLDWVRGHVGPERYWLAPTLCWLWPTDACLDVLCAGGVLASVLLIAGILPAAAAGLAWLFYLSLAVAGQTFLEFQWDMLLLETGLLAVFLCSPRRLRIRRGLAAGGCPLFLLRWLLFRLMFSSGVVKLASGDPAWRSLTGLRYHYATQPLPPWTAWFLHQAPPWFQTVSCVFLFAVELAVPFLFFAPRRLRLVACGMTITLEVLIAATGNYAFFNLLAIALALLLIDDDSFPARWRDAARREKGKGRWPRWILAPAAAILLAACAVPLAASIGGAARIPGPLISFYRLLAPLRSSNGYGLFAVMTTSRPEIIVEGSEDGTVWREYAFAWKPGDAKRAPRFVAPHQPRLDWQMWFAALGSYEENPWLIRFLGRLLEGSPEVLGLLARNPFPHGPPRFVRAVVYDYRFTDFAARRRSGDWWQREAKGLYCPVLSRESLSPPSP
ncbi:MAG: lipase maturation factor family protein [Acidobacteriota bacterium]